MKIKYCVYNKLPRILAKRCTEGGIILALDRLRNVVNLRNVRLKFIGVLHEKSTNNINCYSFIKL